MTLRGGWWWRFKPVSQGLHGRRGLESWPWLCLKQMPFSISNKSLSLSLSSKAGVNCIMKLNYFWVVNVPATLAQKLGLWEGLILEN